MKHESETPSLEKLQRDRYNKIKELEFELCYNKLLSKEERDTMYSEMWFLTRKFNYPYSCQNA